MYSVKKLRGEKYKRYLLNMLGGKCVRCGSVEELQFDHIDPNTMSFRIGVRKTSYCLERLIEEAKKCQLLCPDCHWQKTRKDRGLEPKRHGTINMYTNGYCRCASCSAVRRKYSRAYYLARRANSVL